MVAKDFHFLKLLLAGLLWLVLATACGQTETVNTATPVPFIPDASPGATTTMTPTPEPVHTPDLYFTPSPQPETDTPISTSDRRIRVCSPLQGHSSGDLQEIITNPFDPPPTGKDSGHHGIDFAYYRRGSRLSIEGVLVQSVFAGQIAAAIQNRPPYGNMVIVETKINDLPQEIAGLFAAQPIQSLYLLYAHMTDKPLVQAGDQVDCGQMLGAVGNTPAGWSSAPHLHFEARIGPGEVTFSGMAYYDTSASLAEMDNYKRWRMSDEFHLVDPTRLLGFIP